MQVELRGGPRAAVEVVEVPQDAGRSLIVSAAAAWSNGQVSEAPRPGNSATERYELRSPCSEGHRLVYEFVGYAN
jgi:hypothetical protein